MAPKTFVSYAHDSDAHKEWVRKLATDLRGNGIDAILDQWDLPPGADLSMFMQRGISESDRVILICSENYVIKAEAGSGGVGYERLIVTSEVVQNIDTKKFIPIVRNNTSSSLVPNFLGPRLYIDFRDDEAYMSKCEDLFREIHGLPAIAKPPLGSNPYSTTAPKPIVNPAQQGAASVPRTRDLIDEPWFARERSIARRGIAAIQREASMELRFRLHDPINKSQNDLLEAVRNARITTFGWPIAVLLGNRDEYRPRPRTDGICAEISINEKGDRTSYDYWALRSNGDFFLLQSLFEDERRPGEIFFDTRIVRVTEALLFAQKLYNNLDVSSETRLELGVSHRGLSERKLTSANISRSIIPALSHEAESHTQVTVEIGKISDDLVDHVKAFLDPLFMLFDFQQFDIGVYTDIARRFESGEVS